MLYTQQLNETECAVMHRDDFKPFIPITFFLGRRDIIYTSGTTQAGHLPVSARTGLGAYCYMSRQWPWTRLSSELWCLCCSKCVLCLPDFQVTDDIDWNVSCTRPCSEADLQVAKCGLHPVTKWWWPSVNTAPNDQVRVQYQMTKCKQHQMTKCKHSILHQARAWNGRFLPV